MSRGREWITRPATERKQLEAEGWRLHSETVRQVGKWGWERVVIMFRDASADLFAGDAA